VTPEEKARQRIDEQLTRCGWVVQDYADMDIYAGPGVAVREFPLKSGEADYLLYTAGGRVPWVAVESLLPNLPSE
jgi:type I restriction enzyme R subunit